jgi:hypothetical protein
MAMSQLILARPDSSCGKVFHANRRGAEQQRVALEIWNRANGCGKENYRLVSFQCNRCGGFHIGQKRIDRLRPRKDSHNPSHEINSEALLTLEHHRDRKRSKRTSNAVWTMALRRGF